MDHHHRRNGNVVTNGSYHSANKPEATETTVNNKKKTRKWSLGGLFKRRRAKSSDTDSSTELEDSKKKSFLAFGSPTRHKSASHKVVGKFDAIILPRNNEVPPPHKITNGYATLNTTSIERYDASPLVIKREIHPFRNSQELVAKGSNGSIDNASRRNGKQRIKAKVEAMRDRLGDSSSSDEYGGSSKTSNSSSLQRQNGDTREGGSLSRKSRAARTDRYIRRHFRENVTLPSSGSDPRLAVNGLKLTPAGSPQNRWVARVVYQQSHGYPTRSATSSPLNSPLSQSKDYLQCSSLPGKRSSALLYEPHDVFDDEIANYPRSCEYLPKAAPPPPPRNPYRKIVPMDRCVEGRPSSYAFDANARSTDIAAYINQSRPYGYRSPPDRLHRLQRKSSSDAALQSADRMAQLGPALSPKYCTDKSPRSRNPIQLVRKPEPEPVSDRPMLVSENGFHHDTSGNNSSSLKKANEIGIPVAQLSPPVTYKASVVNNVSRKTYPERGGVRGRPLSVVSEKSDSEFLQPIGGGGERKPSSSSKDGKKSNQNPRNLEEALVELEEIYNSLRLSDEDLLDRAERRDLQSALRMNPNFSRHSWQDLDEDEVDGDGTDADSSRKVFSVECLCSPTGGRNLFSPRLPSTRRSARPDRVADDMAYRKLNKRGSGDPISNPNLVSQSGSFLLVSPALSPPPLVDVQPIIAQIDKEPDVTLDDVVFRNYHRTNNTLKVVDPQPPFGIPLGPVSPAPNSDYLHATPSEKYRSTFNPMRTPDVVKDDLAFRNLRKDVRPELAAVAQQLFIVPRTNDSRKRRAIRSLSANIVSMMGKDTSSYSSDNEEEESSATVDVNCNNLSKSDRSASYNDLPDILADYCRRRRTLIKNCDECLDRGKDEAEEKVEVEEKVTPARAPASTNGHTVTQVADEARMLSTELRQKLRELDALPPTSISIDEELCQQQPRLQSQAFRKRVALHKPITLSQFQFDDRSEEGALVGHDEIDGDVVVPNGGTNLNEEYELQGECATYECDGGFHDDDNSSSGVSSTSNSPDSSYRADDLNSVMSDFHLGAEVAAAGSTFSQPAALSEATTVAPRCDVKSKTLPNARYGSRHASGAVPSVELNDGSRKCSRIEITLSSPPQPSGTTASLSSSSSSSSLVPTLVANFDVIAFAIVYCIACLHTVFFTTFSILEMALLLISVLAYFIVYRRR